MLLAEWLALIAELDRVLRQEHATSDINPRMSLSYYKAVLLERQEALRTQDLAGDEVLLMEVCATAPPLARYLGSRLPVLSNRMLHTTV